MYKGKKRCDCGRFFIFETVREYVECFECKKRFVSKEIGEWVELEETEDGESVD